MIVRSIELENFRPFFGSQKIEFSDGVNIINAQQGGGKTSLFSAFYWCLFDRIYNSTYKEWIKNPNLEVVLNKQAFNGAKTNGEELRCSVKLNIEKRDSNNRIEKYSITRVYVGEKNEEDISNVKEDLEILFFDDQGANPKKGKEAEVFIDQFLFPESLSDYIWFQGEFINRLINLDSSDSFKKVLNTISYIDYYQMLTKLLSTAIVKNQSTKTKKLKNQNQKDKDVAALGSSIEFLNKEIQNLRDKEPELNTQLTILNEELRSLKSKITSNDSSKDLLGEISNLKEAYRKQIEARERIDQQYRESLGNKWMLKGLSSLIEQADLKMHEFDKAYAKATKDVYELPIHTPDDNTLRDMLKAYTCLVCGTPAPEGSKEYKNIESKIGRAVDATKKLDPESQTIYKAINSISRIPEELLVLINEIDDEIEKLDKDEEEISNEINILGNDLEKNLEKKKAKEKELGISNLEDFSSNVERNTLKLIEVDRKQVDKEKEITQLGIDIKTKENEITRLNTRLNSIAKDQRESLIEMEIEIVLERLKLAVIRTKDVEYTKLVKDIESATNILLDKALTSNDSIKVKIDINPKTNEIQRLDLTGNNLDLELNTGHDALINLCLIMAIISKSNSYSNQSFTFLSDAPTSSLDPDVSLDWTYLNSDVFEQSIILNKDLINLEPELVKSEKIASIFRLETVKTNDDINDSSIENQYSRITKIK